MPCPAPFSQLTFHTLSCTQSKSPAMVYPGMEHTLLNESAVEEGNHAHPSDQVGSDSEADAERFPVPFINGELSDGALYLPRKQRATYSTRT